MSAVAGEASEVDHAEQGASQRRREGMLERSPHGMRHSSAPRA